MSNDAENGDAKAQMKMGIMLELGVVVPKDEKKAAKWFRLTAEQGIFKAQSIMYLIYANGQRVPQDDEEALKWYRLATEKSITQEKMRIINGTVQDWNDPQALKILTDDAESGVLVAQYYLGMTHANGQGITGDYVLAHMWYNLSALQVHEGARSQINLLEKRMSPQQIEQA